MKATQQIPADVAGYNKKLQEYHLAVAEWLDFNPDQVHFLSVSEPGHGQHAPVYATISWCGIAMQTPRVGHSVWHVSRSEGGVEYAGTVTLNHYDSEAFLAAIGPEPRLGMTANR